MKVAVLFFSLLVLPITNLYGAWNDLHKAVYASDAAAVARLAASSPHFLNEQSPSGQTPLHVAIENSTVKIVSILLSCNARHDIPDSAGYLPLHNAAAIGNSEMANLLIQHGAPVDATTRAHQTPLIIAAANAQTETAKFFLSKGANTAHQDDMEYSPLFWARWYQNQPLIDLLYSYNPELRLQNKDAKPLH